MVIFVLVHECATGQRRGVFESAGFDAQLGTATEGKPPLHVGKVVKIRLRIPEGTITVDGRAVWLHRAGFRKYQIGIEFVNVKRSITAALDMLGRFGFLTVGDAAAVMGMGW